MVKDDRSSVHLCGEQQRLVYRDNPVAACKVSGMIDLSPAFICQVVKVHDGDGPLWCRNGKKVRVAGIQAPDYESAQPCRTGRTNYVCDDRAAAASQRAASV